jgi:PAS domain S-box-containing protein
MFYCDRNGTILDVNGAFTKHYGYTAKEVIGKNPGILRSRHSTDGLYRQMWKSILDPSKGFWSGQIINKAKNGKELPVLLTITAVKNSAGETIGYISNGVDLSKLMTLQTRLADSEALAAVGEMAAAVAHEIRNPLGSIVMAARQLIEEKLDAEDRLLVLQVLRNESLRVNETLTNFLTYARPRELHRRREDVKTIVKEVLRMIIANKKLIGRIKTNVYLDEKYKPFLLDPDLIRQVVWNIMLNAVQALEGKGTLTVKTGRENGQAYIQIKDNGPGIPPDKIKDIFKAFHTTKPQGTGLGLAIAERIVRSHGGRIETQSRGRGASFTIYLPMNED